MLVRGFLLFAFTLISTIVLYGVLVSVDLYFGTGSSIKPIIRASGALLITILLNLLYLRKTRINKTKLYYVSFSAIGLFYVFVFVHFLNE
jgi:hypothetical protein